MDPQKQVDIIVPVKDEELLIAKKLENIALQSYPHILISIVVVDSSRSDACERAVRAFSLDHPDIRIVFIKDSERLGKANALNQAFAQCRGAICIITDVDVRFDERAISDLIRSFDDPLVGAVSAVEVLEHDGQATESRVYRGFYNTLRIAESRVDSALMCESELAGYRRELLVSLPKNTQCDDMSLTLNIRKQGYRAVYNPHVFFYESEGVDRRAMLLQKTRRARANIHELLRNVDLILSPRLGVFSRTVLPLEVFLNVLAPILLLGSLVMYAFLLLDTSTAILSTAVFCMSAASLTVATALCNIGPNMEKGVIPRLRRGLISLIAFAEFNGVMILALLLLAIKGPQTSWNPITRGAERQRA